jgi:CMP-N,N'-diacetyllegionaminic acid synthase
MNIFCLVTGRGNNTLKDKNILPVLNRPLVTYPALAAKKAIDNDNLYISSDCDKILGAVSEYNFIPIKRPSSISGPDAKHIDAITHGLSFIENDRNCKVDILVVLLANSATVKSEWIEDAINMIKNDNSISAVVPAYKEQDHHPYRAKKLSPEGDLVPYFDFGDENISTNRQELDDNYFLCHNFWVLNIAQSIDKLDGFKPWVFLGKKVKPIIVKGCFDVHTVEDLEKTEAWVKQNIINTDG